jgi:hypothetical protein
LDARRKSQRSTGIPPDNSEERSSSSTFSPETEVKVDGSDDQPPPPPGGTYQQASAASPDDLGTGTGDDRSSSDDVDRDVRFGKAAPAYKEKEHLMLLREAEDCQVLVAYLARQKDTNVVAKGDNAEFIDIPRQILSGSYSVQDVVDLHRVMQELSAAAHPATAQSIRDSRYADDLGLKRREEKGFHFPAIVIFGCSAFLLTFTLGLYVAFTDRVLEDYRADVVEYYRITQNQFEDTRLGFLLRSPLSDSDSSEADQPPNVAPIIGDDTPSSDFATDTEPVDQPVDQATLKRRALQQISREIAQRQEMLRNTTFGLAPASLEEGGAGGGQTLMDESALNLQAYINRIITSFALPICASIVGAFVFILRDRTRRLESVSLVSRQVGRYWPRIMVAIIAGIIIGWFSDRDSSGVLTSLTPAAAAFVVGYSLEIFFNLLDSIKTALGVRET